MMFYTLIALIVMMAYQQWFWMRQTQKLVDKLMSRSYTEYISATKPKPEKARDKIIVTTDFEDLGSLDGIRPV